MKRSFPKFGECCSPVNIILNADIYSNYGLTEDFKLIQTTFGILHAIDLRLKQSIFWFLNEADDDNDSNDSKDQEETASEQSQFETIDVESDSELDQEQVIKKKKSSEPCHHYQNWNVFAFAVVKFPSYFWHDNCDLESENGH